MKKIFLLFLLIINCQYSIVKAQTLTPENQVIYLRHIIEQTTDEEQREAAITLMAQAGTYQALTYCARLMGDKKKTTAKAAAQAVWNILYSHPEYNGTESRQMLSDATTLMKKKQKKQALAWLTAVSKDEEGFSCR